MTSGDYEFQEQQAMDAHNQALFAELRDREISLHNREAAKLHGRAATIRRLLEGRALYRQVAAELYQMHEATGPVPEDVSLSDALCYVDEFAAEAAESIAIAAAGGGTLRAALTEAAGGVDPVLCASAEQAEDAERTTP
ncbi:MAG: hypothetical protein WC114_02705 [Smithellaceae bacterium]|jgi:hypothetical protein